jgi:hypothetical protein
MVDWGYVLNYVTAGWCLLILAGLLRWGVKVDRNITAQAVINQETLKAMTALADRVSGLEDSRFDDLERRVALAEERPVASNGPQRHARKRS